MARSNAPSVPPRAVAPAASRGAAPAAPAPADSAAGMIAGNERVEQDKVLPLPGWLVKVYFIFPIVLYIPDAIFNYFVYSDGLKVPAGNPVLQGAQIALWGFMSIGVVGMAYLLSVLAPWHWGQGHRVQALFCGLGVIIATAITTWNSLAFRSQNFQSFNTDTWAKQLWPQITHLSGFSLTMILVAVAPPFWGLFWAIVQPTQTGRSLRQLQESHTERLLRLEQEAELKRARAEANAKVRAAQLRGLAQTAAAARDQAKEILGRPATATVVESTLVNADGASEGDENGDTGSDSGELPVPPRVLQLPTGKAPTGREAAGGRNEAVFFNHASSATPSVHAAPSGPVRPAAAQPALLSEADVQAAPAASLGDPTPWGARRPVPGGGIMGAFFSDDDQMTGTTGPRPAVRRPGENSVLFRGISEDMSARALTAVQEVYDELSRELNPDGVRKTMPKKEFVQRLMRRLNVDESTAQKALDQWYKTKKGNRSGQR